ncbi:MAG: hypothetical protein GY852_08890 [bacterium]|nr:hypothetical protein [bacterium]
MMMGGLRLFGTGRNVQKPAMRERAAKAFAKYHERVMERMENPRTRIGLFMMLMLAKRAQKSEETAGVKKGLDELDGRLERREIRSAGITQDARGWYDQCGRPRYPIQ